MPDLQFFEAKLVVIRCGERGKADCVVLETFFSPQNKNLR
jgi:hypothetical protein